MQSVYRHRKTFGYFFLQHQIVRSGIYRARKQICVVFFSFEIVGRRWSHTITAAVVVQSVAMAMSSCRPNYTHIYIKYTHLCVCVCYCSDGGNPIYVRAGDSYNLTIVPMAFPRRACTFSRTYTSLAAERYGTFLYADIIARTVYII